MSMRAETSYRVLRNRTLAKHLQILPQESDEVGIPAWDEIPILREKGKDPYAILDAIVHKYGIQIIDVQECIRLIGAGSSPWIQLSHFLLKVRPARVE